MKEHILTLSKLGLTSNESAIYIVLLEHGTLSVAEIATITSLYRQQVYRALPHLMELGLVHSIATRNRNRYASNDPERLRWMALALKSESEDLIYALQDLRREGTQKLAVHTLEGVSGIKSIFIDIVTTLNPDEVFYHYSTVSNLPEINRLLPKNYRIMRDKKRLKRYLLANQTIVSQKQTRFERDMKVIDLNTSHFNQNIDQFIYGNKVAIIDMTSKSALIIEHCQYADLQREIFLSFWDKIDTTVL